jgi:hypothetical protein
MSDLARILRDRIRAAVRDGKDGVNIAAAVNVNRDGRTTAVYSDDDVTIVQRDGDTEIFSHFDEPTDPEVDTDDH